MMNEVSQSVVFLQNTLRETRGSDKATTSAVPAAERAVEADSTLDGGLQVEQISQQPLDASTVESNAEKLAENLNEFMQQIQRKLRFSVDDATGSTVIHVIDLETEETIRQIPAEEILTLRKHFQELQNQLYGGEEVPGLLFKSQV